jgi:hypothetical protein
MLETIERPLTSDEYFQLQTRLQTARAESGTALLKSGAASAAVCGVLMVLTLLASDAPVIVVVGFWVVMMAVFTVWIGMPGRRLMLEQVQILQDALHGNRARERRLQSDRVVEFEEVEDEGACYAFDHDGVSSIFVIGQEFYEGDDFPNSDFSMIELLGASGTPIDVLLTKRGRKLTPERVIPSAIKDGIEWPEHLSIVPAPLDRIESALRSH